MSTFFENTLKIVREAGAIAHIPREILSKLETPNNLLEFVITIDGKSFPAWRIQHNNALGPYKGGIRFHQDANKDEVMALAFLMAIKNAVIGLPYGGAKGAVKVDPRSLSTKELEQLSREYVRHIAKAIGPDVDIPAPDVGTSPEIMAWMADEYRKIIGHEEPAAFTGKPVEKGGSEGREIATGFGGFMILREFLRSPNYSPQSTSVAIQGFGNVGGNLARILFKEGFRVVALSDSRSVIYNPDGLNVEEVVATQKEKGRIAGGKCSLEEAAGGACRVLTNKELLELDVDVLIPAALENQLTEENAENVKAKIVLELANGPTTEEADEILERRGVIVIPDILANAGGVAGSYFEWLQSKERKWWDEQTVLAKIEETMVRAFADVKKTHEEMNLPWRKAAYVLAITRIADAMKTAAPLKEEKTA